MAEQQQRTIDDLSRDDLLRLAKRDRWVKEQQAGRISALMHENLELLGLLNEANEDLAATRAQITAAVESNGDVTIPGAPADVTS